MIGVVVNPAAGRSGDAEALLSRIGETEGVELLRSGSAEEMERRAEAAARAGSEALVAAGGDGTLNVVVNAVARAGALDRVRLGLLPLGTGNDMSRTLEIPLDPEAAWEAFCGGRVQKLDAIEVSSAGESRLCVNVAAGGFSGQVDEALTPELERSWGPLAYIRSAGQVLPDLDGYETTLAFDGGAPEHVELLNVVVANGRTTAGGVLIAPRADPTDGWLDVVLVEYAPTLDLAALAVRLLVGDYTQSELVRHRRARGVAIASKPGMWFNLDGELYTKEPVTFRMKPGALSVVVPAR